jgi:hypothetical protein
VQAARTESTAAQSIAAELANNAHSQAQQRAAMCSAQLQIQPQHKQFMGQ